ncbi:MAG: hypothetical protein AB3N23_01890 [Paracoccaceae bacterium]
MERTPAPIQPIETLRDGRLKATIWENSGQSGLYHSVTLAKTFEDRDGKLQDSNSFTGAELLRVAELAREAHSYVREARRDMAAEQQQEPANKRPRPNGRGR